MTKEVRKACVSCGKCQKAGNQTEWIVPLLPMPIMWGPFERVAIDIVDPLPRTNNGNKYLLTLLDYRTRYPEVVSLKSTDTASVEAALMSFLTRLGMPMEILSDQGANIWSKLMTELCVWLM